MKKIVIVFHVNKMAKYSVFSNGVKDQVDLCIKTVESLEYPGILLISGGKIGSEEATRASMVYELVKNRLPQSKISKVILEQRAKNVFESVINTKKLLKDYEISHIYSLVYKKYKIQFWISYLLYWPQIISRISIIC